MATQSEGGGKDELKTQFMTRERMYKLMTFSEYSRPTRFAFNGQRNTPVKVLFNTCTSTRQGCAEGQYARKPRLRLGLRSSVTQGQPSLAARRMW